MRHFARYSFSISKSLGVYKETLTKVRFYLLPFLVVIPLEIDTLMYSKEVSELGVCSAGCLK